MLVEKDGTWHELDTYALEFGNDIAKIRRDRPGDIEGHSLPDGSDIGVQKSKSIRHRVYIASKSIILHLPAWHSYLYGNYTNKEGPAHGTM